MQTFVKNKTLQQRLNHLRKKGKTIGFSPTMGALHDGHLSLIMNSKKNCDVSLASIFVNPTQFNDKSDLEKYPTPVNRDKTLLKSVGLDILYKPTMDQIYPKGLNTRIDLNLYGLDEKLDGAFRPGHFEGVVEVVYRLLDIVKPDKLFMGQKDFQQFTIIKHMIRELSLPVELVVVPIKREKDGLAMSSRNVRLTPEFRQKATILNQSLKDAKKSFRNESIGIIKNAALDRITKIGLKPEYFELVDGYTLKKLKSKKDTNYIVALVAAWAGDVRLIDNEIICGG